MFKRLLQLCVLALPLSLPSPAFAAELPPEAGAARTVAMFDIFCLSQLPDLEAIEKVAKAGDFEPLTGAELEKYQPEVKAEELKAWRYKDFEEEFVLTMARTLPDAQFKKDAPEFADSVNFGCSLLIPAKDAKDALLAEMKKVMERDPDETWDQAPLKAHSWSGQTDKLLVFIYYYAPLEGDKGGFLSANVSVKNE
jgi:hypothetical protein